MWSETIIISFRGVPLPLTHLTLGAVGGSSCGAIKAARGWRSRSVTSARQEQVVTGWLTAPLAIFRRPAVFASTVWSREAMTYVCGGARPSPRRRQWQAAIRRRAGTIGRRIMELQHDEPLAIRLKTAPSTGRPFDPRRGIKGSLTRLFDCPYCSRSAPAPSPFRRVSRTAAPRPDRSAPRAAPACSWRAARSPSARRRRRRSSPGRMGTRRRATSAGAG